MRRKHTERLTCERLEKIKRVENFNDFLLLPLKHIEPFDSHYIDAQDVPPISEKEEEYLKKSTTCHKIPGTRRLRVYGKLRKRPNSPYCTVAGCVRKAGSFFPKCKSHWGKGLSFSRNKKDQVCRSDKFIPAGTILDFLYSAGGTRPQALRESKTRTKTPETKEVTTIPKQTLIPSLRGFPSIRLDSSKDPKNLPARYFGLSTTDYNLELIPFSGGKLYKRVLLTKERYEYVASVGNKDQDEYEDEDQDEDQDEDNNDNVDEDKDVKVTKVGKAKANANTKDQHNKHSVNQVASIIYCCPIVASCDIYEKSPLVLKACY